MRATPGSARRAQTIGDAFRFARREMRGGAGPLRLLFACLLLGVFALAAVGSLGAAIRGGLAAEGRELLGGDIQARWTQAGPTPEQQRALEALGTTSSGMRMRAMVRRESGAPNNDLRRESGAPSEGLRRESGAPNNDLRRESGAQDRQLLGELKAVDDRWPLYGTATLVGGGSVQAALKTGAVVSKAMADQMALHVGDGISIGEGRFTVSGILADEPDRAGEGFALGPSVLIALDAMPTTALVQPGSLYERLIRVKLPPSADPAEAHDALDRRFPDAGWRLSDSRDGAPGIRRFVDRLQQFLTLVSLSSLAVAGVGVANGVSSYLDRRMAGMASLKAMGASSRFLLAIYLIVVLSVAAAAAVVGAALGSLAPFIAVRVAGTMFPVPPALGIYPLPLVAAAGAGMLIALVFAIPPLVRAGAIPAQRIFRGRLDDWPWPSRRAFMLSAIPALLLLGLTLLGAEERLFTLYFLIGVTVAVLILYLIGRGFAALAARLPHPHSLPARMALANLRRPGAMVPQLVVALGLGLTLLACLSMIETSFQSELNRTVPSRAPAFFILDLPKEDATRFRETLPAGSEVRMVPSLRGPITHVRDVPVAQLPPAEGAWILRGDRGITWSAAIPEGNSIVSGTWWPADYAGPPLVSMDAEQAGLLGLKVGDFITVSVLGVEIRAKIASLRRIDWDSLGFNFAMLFDPSSLAGAPYSYMATVSPPAADEAAFTGRISRAFPTASVIRVKDIVTQVSLITDRIGVAIRAAAAIAILAGIAVLVGAISAQAQGRIRDNVILKALGATRGQLIAVALIEYALLGAVVAIVALALASAGAWFVLTQLLDLGWHPDWTLATATVAAGGAVAVLLGLAGTMRILGAKISPALAEQ